MKISSIFPILQMIRLAAVMFSLAVISSMANAAEVKFKLSGDVEVPPVTTMATVRSPSIRT